MGSESMFRLLTIVVVCSANKTGIGVHFSFGISARRLSGLMQKNLRDQYMSSELSDVWQGGY